MLSEFILSIYSYFKAISAIKEYKLIKYVILLIMLLFLFVFPVVFIGETAHFFSKFIPFINGGKIAKMGSGFLSSISGFFLLLFLIPVFTLVSDEVNQHIRGVKHKFSIQQFSADIFRGLKITFRNFVYQYVLIILFLIGLRVFSDNTFFELIVEGIIFIITSYFYGFSLMDYAMENHKMNYVSSVDFARSHVGLVTGLGMVYYAIIRINDISFFKEQLGDLSIYWTTIAEAVVAFVGVIAANIVLNSIIKE